MQQPLSPALEGLIFEIVLKATYRVCTRFDLGAALAEEIADPLASAMVDLVIAQGNDTRKPEPMKLRHFASFEVWNMILDEIAKEIPVANHLEIVGEVTRSQRVDFLSGKWQGS